MAVSATSYFSNSIQGIPGIAGDVDLYDSATTPKFQIGYCIKRADGNSFAYGHFGAATSAGELVSQDLSESAVADTDNAIIAPASAQTTTDGTAGSKFFEATVASITADQFAGGYVVITDDSGEGHTYRVKGNTATGNPAAGNIRVELYDKLVVAVDATSDFAILGSKYANLEAATTTDVAASGVALAAQAAGDYGWVQTEGIAGVLQDGAIAIGTDVIIGSVAGSVATDAGANVLERVGTCLVAGDDTGHAIVKLKL